ncbi:MAG: hypothetical protein MZV70_66075 [Desulfobacterales bacterium]|nr:hypothetical protein [Desulfobacterales bacterium]
MRAGTASGSPSWPRQDSNPGTNLRWSAAIRRRQGAAPPSRSRQGQPFVLLRCDRVLRHGDRHALDGQKGLLAHDRNRDGKTHQEAEQSRRTAGDGKLSTRPEEQTGPFALPPWRNGDRRTSSAPSSAPPASVRSCTLPSPEPSASADAPLEVDPARGDDHSPPGDGPAQRRRSGEMVLDGQTNATATIPIPRDALLDGDNLLSLRAVNGRRTSASRTKVRLTYQRAYRADDDTLTCTAEARNTCHHRRLRQPRHPGHRHHRSAADV